MTDIRKHFKISIDIQDMLNEFQREYQKKTGEYIPESVIIRRAIKDYCTRNKHMDNLN